MCGRILGLPVTVIVPTTTKPLMLDKIRAQGAEVQVGRLSVNIYSNTTVEILHPFSALHMCVYVPRSLNSRHVSWLFLASCRCTARTGTRRTRWRVAWSRRTRSPHTSRPTTTRCSGRVTAPSSMRFATPASSPVSTSDSRTAFTKTRLKGLQ